MTAEQVPIPTCVGLVDVANVLLRLLSLCQVCSTTQAGRLYAHCTQPNRRIREVLRYLRERGYIESWRYAYDKPAVHRLSKRIRREYGLPAARWDARLDHKLAVTDLYMDLGMPDDFITEYRQPFTWNGKQYTLSPDAYAHGMYVEVQRTSIETRDWSEKRKRYERYFMSHQWEGVFEEPPIVVVVQTHNQQLSTIGQGIGYTLRVVRDIREVMQCGD